jgi:ATP-dependent Clp protease adaptor protein ClpS
MVVISAIEGIPYISVGARASFLRPPLRYIVAYPKRLSRPKGNATMLQPVMMTDRKDGTGDDTSVVTKTRAKTQRPPLYKVLLLNDDYTPMEFVVHVLERFFGLSHAQAFEIMLTVHKKGLAVVGVFSFEVAETKVAQVMDFARRHQHPLQCTMEKE